MEDSYYDEASKTFVGQFESTIKTVITNVKPQYIENLKKLKP